MKTKLAVAVSLVVLGAACSESAHPDASPTRVGTVTASTTLRSSVAPHTGATSPTTMNIAPRAGRLVDRPCDTSPRYDADCYWLEVPERRDIADARTIRLWVVVVHQNGPDALKPPVLELSGGPGDPASWGWVAGSIVLDGSDSRTIVMMDQRGTGRSQPRLDCPEFGERPDAATGWADRHAKHRRSITDCRSRLIGEGIDLDGYDTAENAADFVDLRKALDVDQFLIRGLSYGGRLAREIYRQDPNGAAGLVLDSPLTTAPQGPATLLARADDAIARLAAACADQPTCAAKGPVEEQLATAAEQLNAQPYTTSSGLLIDGNLLYNGIFVAMFDSFLIPALPGVIESVAGGDYAILAALADQLTAQPEDPPNRIAYGLFEVMQCADEGAALTPADQEAITAPGRWEDLIDDWQWACDLWDVDPVPGGRLADPAGDVPVLVMSGALDPVTPPGFADEVLRQFPHATVVSIPAGGHGVAFVNDCAASITLSFTADPAAPVDTTCAALLPAPFAN